MNSCKQMPRHLGSYELRPILKLFAPRSGIKRVSEEIRSLLLRPSNCLRVCKCAVWACHSLMKYVISASYTRLEPVMIGDPYEWGKTLIRSTHKKNKSWCHADTKTPLFRPHGTWLLIPCSNILPKKAFVRKESKTCQLLDGYKI